MDRPQYTYVRESAGVEAARFAFRDTDTLALDTEGIGLDPHIPGNRLRLIQLAARVANKTVCYVFDLNHIQPQSIQPILDRAKKVIIQNAAHDLKFLWLTKLRVPFVWDTMLASQVKAKGDFLVRHNLAAICMRELGVVVDKESQDSDWSAAELSTEQLDYAARDAILLLDLHDTMRKDLLAEGLGTTATVEFGAIPAIAQMEYVGMPIDPAEWENLCTLAEVERSKYQLELDAMVDFRDMFGTLQQHNWNSPDLVGKQLHDLGVDVPDTAEGTLAWYKDQHPMVQTVIDYREFQTLISKFGMEWLSHSLHPSTHRVHCRIIPMGARTGRCACAKPNLQQIPRFERDGIAVYRKPFRAPDGWAFIKADYSQIELRIAAQIARDSRMIEAYNKNIDLHTLTASLVLGKPVEAVTKQDRQIAKSLNFGLLYGAGPDTLRNYALKTFGVLLSKDEAYNFRQKFFATYAGLKRWHRSTGENPNPIHTRTLGGRIRANVALFSEKLNTPVQGTGADMMKAAAAAMWRDRASQPQARFVLTVHDELDLLAPISVAEEVRQWTVKHMTQAAQHLLPDVPVEVEAHLALDWAGTPLAA